MNKTIKEFNLQQLARDVFTKRNKLTGNVTRETIKQSSLRGTAEKIKISFATLSRIEHCKMPDLITYMKICNWLGKRMDYYFK